MMADVAFDIVRVRAVGGAASPTVALAIRIRTTPPTSVHTGILRCQLHIDPRRRRYSEREAERLHDVFDAPARWNDTMRPLIWAQAPLALPRFDGEVEVELPIACTYDFALASSKYFHALEDGDVPVVCQFSGTLFLASDRGFQVSQVPWDKEAAYRVPVHVWRDAMNAHFPDSAWIRLRRDAFDALALFKTQQGLPTWEAAIETLCTTFDEREQV